MGGEWSRRKLRDEREHAVSELFGQYDGGACFGMKLPSRDVHAVRSKYTECLGKTLDRLSDYLTESSTLVDAAREILSRY